MIFDKRDFQDMRFRVDEVDVLTYNPLRSFPELKKYPEFSKTIIESLQPDAGKMFAYVAYCYDFKSPYVMNSDNIVKRKKEALLASGFKQDENNRFSELAEQILANRHPKVNAMIVRYVRILKSSSWMTLVGYEETLAKHILWMTSGQMEKDGETVDIEPTAYKAVINNTETLKDLIDKLRSELLSGDNNPDLQKAVYDSIEMDDLNITPEEIAMHQFMGENPKLFNPYKEELTIEEFIQKHVKTAERYDSRKQHGKNKSFSFKKNS